MQDQYPGPQAEQSALLAVSWGRFPRRDAMKNVVWFPLDFSGACCPLGPALLPLRFLLVSGAPGRAHRPDRRVGRNTCAPTRPQRGH